MDALLKTGMNLALEQARQSLRGGNHGFGAVILKDGEVLACAHDTEETGEDPTAHAEINAIRKAASLVGKTLSDCILLTPHEPCPMCAAAIVWAKIPYIGYGFSTQDAIGQGRRRINLSAAELFQKAGADIRIAEGILHQECAILYNASVQAEVEKLRGASDEQLRYYNQQSTTKRLDWYGRKGRNIPIGDGNILEKGYRLLLRKLDISEAEASIVGRQKGKIVFHSKNFCPTLEACRILHLDTRRICRLVNEGATDMLLRQLNPMLRFGRNYERLRPCSEYCEEWIEYSGE
jgi:tRNA(Arg) A34 adenosine deaminase TadA